MSEKKEINREKTVLLTGTSNPELAKSISAYLSLPLCNAVVDTFSNTETRVVIKESVRKKHVYIIQTGAATREYDYIRTVNDHLMDTLILVDAVRRGSAKSINVILACYPYARQDKKDRARAPISSSLVAGMLQTAGVDRVLSVELHADQIQGMFKVPVDNIYAEQLLIDGLKNTQVDLNDIVIVSPDAGGTKRAVRFGKTLGVEVALMHKQRNYSEKNQVDRTVLLGEVKNKTAVIVDDMGDTCGTLCSAAKTCVDQGAKDVIAVLTHGIFSGPALARLESSNEITLVLTTNTILQKKNQTCCPKIVVCDIGPIVGEAILRLANGGSISEMFK